ncbi:MAG TPA: dephospho-CoA kinase [Terriglobales bacterium]|nr:dephospho-CoA kinase [Terriglobales bacterium]
MLRVGLTGGLSCGKSTVARMFAERGASVIQADSIARELTRPGNSVFDQVVKQFGPEIVQPDGSLDRAKLADLAFAGGRIAELNGIVHPAVIERQEKWMEAVERNDPQGVAVVEAALILEARVGRRFDKLVVVTCEPLQKVERFAKRHTISLEAAKVEVARRQAAMMPDEEKIKAANYVIDNSGTPEEAARQVDAIYAELKRLAAETAKGEQP